MKMAWNNRQRLKLIWAASSEFVSSSIPSWQILTAHAQPFRLARDLAFCLKVPLDSLLIWTSNGGSGETARMRRLAWTFTACIGDKYQIRLTRLILSFITGYKIMRTLKSFKAPVRCYHLSRSMTKPTKDLCAQHRLRSASASAQSDQSLRYALNRKLRTQGFFMRTVKTLVWLDGCPG